MPRQSRCSSNGTVSDQMPRVPEAFVEPHGEDRIGTASVVDVGSERPTREENSMTIMLLKEMHMVTAASICHRAQCEGTFRAIKPWKVCSLPGASSC